MNYDLWNNVYLCTHKRYYIMKKIFLYVALLSFSPCVMAQTELDELDVDSLPNNDILQHYEQAIDSLVRTREEALTDISQRAENVQLNPYFYRLLMPGTYYNRSLRHIMQIDWEPNNKSAEPVEYNRDAIELIDASDQALARMYVNRPSLIHRMESTIQENAGLRDDAKKTPVSVTPKLSDKAVTVSLDTDAPEVIEIEAKRPNFWKLKGSTSFQFTQSYFSDNWYQGGENNYAGLGTLTLEANFDNKQKIQWDNKLEAQLGFQTAMSDTLHTFRVTNNLLRLTSKIGYKAAKKWFYTGQLLTYTQLYPNYENNSKKVIADFTSPLYLSLSVGIDYKLNKNKFNLSVYLSPVDYNMCWVARKDYDIRPRYGMERRDNGEYRATYHKYGPSTTINYSMTIMKGVTWSSRLYCFANIFDNKSDMYVKLEWENTLNFTINKYLSAKLFLYPRFDNSNDGYKRHGHYIMFKEWLSLGLNYSF